MDYYNILNLVKEPFSNSPDPEFFFQSQQHLVCLQQLELSLYLRRGLNVVIGDVGMGKTTLCRHLIRKFADYGDIETHLILDPHFNSPTEFLSAVTEKFEGQKPPPGADDLTLKEMVKQYLYHKGVHQKRNVVLIIDEGQKLPSFCVELIREFLNYETNKYKLLQIVIFAQKEFRKTLKAHANFADRINFFYKLKPLDFRNTRLMITFRLERSSDAAQPQSLFSYPALRAIYHTTGGYPRKIVNLCHQSILAMIVQNRSVVDWLLVNSCAKKLFPRPALTWHRATTAAAVAVFLFMVAMAGLAPDKLKQIVAPWSTKITKLALFDNSDPKTAALKSNKPLALTKAPPAPLPSVPPNDPKTAVLPLPGLPEPVIVPKKTTETPKAVFPAIIPTPRVSVQVGAFRMEANAQQFRRRLRAKGYTPYVFSTSDKRNKRWFAVRIGDYADLEDAQQAARAYKKKENASVAVTYKDSLRSVSP